jgi:hypothetical protein
MSIGSFLFGGAEFGQFGPLFTYFSVTWWEAVRLFLVADARLADFGERVYLRRAPSRLTYPLLILTPIQATPQIDSTPDFWESSEVQLTVLATGNESTPADVQAESLGQAVYRVLAPKQRQADNSIAPRPRISSLDGYEMGVVPGITRLMEQEGRSTGNLNVWAFVLGYTFLVGRSMVERTEEDLA